MDSYSMRDSFGRSHQIGNIMEHFDLLKEEGTIVMIAGRIMARRAMGKATFFDLQDGSGHIQCYVNFGKFPLAFATIDDDCAIGDIVGITGFVFLTRHGEKTIQVQNADVLTRTMRGIPEKFHGLSNQETRYRKRYLDLIANETVREVFQSRSRIVQAIRNFLFNKGFMEVETPVLQRNPCGASAKPFATKHDSLGVDLFLRISPETFLKQLIVGGFDRIFEIGKNFRNEGMDPSHLQEFTMLEFYVAYWSYRENVTFIQELIRSILMETLGTLKVEYQGEVLDFESPWQQVEYQKLVEGDCGIDVLAYSDAESLKKEIIRKGIDLGDLKGASLGGVIDKLYKKVSRPKLIQPTILLHHPACLIPLARLNEDDSRTIDSFQLLVNGWEIVKAYSELADPVLQRTLLEDQVKQKDSGDEEAMYMDDDFLTSLEHGMPPVSGLGLGIDRFVALLTNQKSLRDVVFFPTMK